MNIQNSIQIISSFSSANSKKMQMFEASTETENINIANQKIEHLEQEKLISLPADLLNYISGACPENDLSFTGVGHPVQLLTTSELSWGAKIVADKLGADAIESWDTSWLLIGYEGGEPIIVKPAEGSNGGDGCTVYSAMQGMGSWDFAPIADSIGQFLLCLSAIEHALNFPGLGDPLDDDFNLAPAAANWLFPLLRQHAGAHYDEWASVFENYLAY
jgi:hypothetical protein